MVGFVPDPSLRRLRDAAPTLPRRGWLQRDLATSSILFLIGLPITFFPTLS